MLFSAVLHGYKRPQSRQSARPFLQSSEFGTPHPLTPRRVCPPHLWFREGDTLACGRGGGAGGPKSDTGDRQCGTLGIYVLCANVSLYCLIFKANFLMSCLKSMTGKASRFVVKPEITKILLYVM
jgi:hypothetical protein